MEMVDRSTKVVAFQIGVEVGTLEASNGNATGNGQHVTRSSPDCVWFPGRAAGGGGGIEWVIPGVWVNPKSVGQSKTPANRQSACLLHWHRGDINVKKPCLQHCQN